MTYKCVNKIIMDNVVPEGYEKYASDILIMHELAKILRKRKVEMGYIEFDIPEAKIVQDETGKCIDIIKREQLEGEKLIEDFMIAANETVATHIFNMGLPFIYRIHGLPKPERIEDFLNMLKILNSRITNNPITGFDRYKKILIANKLITKGINYPSKTKFYIAKRKDLMYEVTQGLYVALSDFSNLGKLIVDLDLFEDFSEEETRMFLKTQGVSSYVLDLDLDTADADQTYAVNVETVLDYDLSEKKKDFEDYKKFIVAVNKFNEPFIKRNFKDSSINQDTIAEDLVVANRNDLDDYLLKLSQDMTTQQSLSKMYARRLFK